MAMRISLGLWFVILFTLGLVLALGSMAKEENKQFDETSNQRSDLVTIDTLKSFGSLERPEVIFPHDSHTDALEKNNKDCKTCHNTDPADKERLSLKFKRIEDTDKEAVMDLYHTECIGCHKETARSDQKTGPVEICGDCHKEKPGVISSRMPMGFDKSLHFRHTEANKDMKTGKGDCGLCHHEYDEKTKKLFYAKGKEGSCRYCHMAKTVENRESMRLAAHTECIDCHLKKLAQKEKKGPIKCSGCHDAEKQALFEKIENIPRLEREQPDYVLLRAVPTPTKEIEKEPEFMGMDPVPFDHKAHEAYNDHCISCHHSSLDSCSKTCHTVVGAKEGDFVRLERAMHQENSKESCLGCHEENQQEPKCAACHRMMKADRVVDASCQTCHMKPMDGFPETGMADEKLVAEKMLGMRTMTTGMYKDEDIPEKVVIKDLADVYEPSELPHRKMIKKLFENIKDSKLAGYFHMDKGTICQSCHHNSPAMIKPPRCASCHGKPFDDANVLIPGLKAAYHQQCMGCHQTLNLEKPKSTSCTDCHKVKEQIASR